MTYDELYTLRKAPSYRRLVVTAKVLKKHRALVQKLTGQQRRLEHRCLVELAETAIGHCPFHIGDVIRHKDTGATILVINRAVSHLYDQHEAYCQGVRFCAKGRISTQIVCSASWGVLSTWKKVGVAQIPETR